MIQPPNPKVNASPKAIVGILTPATGSVDVYDRGASGHLCGGAEHGLTLRLTDRARDFLAEAGYDPVYGARPLKRAIQQHVQDGLALALLEGKFQRGDTIMADVTDGRIEFAKEVVGGVV